MEPIGVSRKLALMPAGHVKGGAGPLRSATSIRKNLEIRHAEIDARRTTKKVTNVGKLTFSQPGLWQDRNGEAIPALHRGRIGQMNRHLTGVMIAVLAAAMLFPTPTFADHRPGNVVVIGGSWALTGRYAGAAVSFRQPSIRSLPKRPSIRRRLPSATHKVAVSIIVVVIILVRGGEQLQRGLADEAGENGAVGA